MGVTVFFSYAEQDRDFREDLAKHLSALERQGVLDTWDEEEIGPGTDWKASVEQKLSRADVTLLLVSSDFLASDYCYDVQVRQAMVRHEAGDVRVIPIIVRAVDWQGTPFSHLKALPQDGKPIAQWPDRDEALLNIAQGLRQAIEEVTEARQAFKSNLYRALLKLGFQQQAELFLRAIDAESVAAFLIHGLAEYGQRWLLNRLIVEYLPFDFIVVKIDFGRIGRSNDVDACWREVGKRLNLSRRDITPKSVTDGVYNWWLNQDVLFLLHEVHLMSEVSLQNLIEQFWLPLIQRVQMAQQGESDRKLLMFLIDYEGKAGQWHLPWVEKLDTRWDPRQPIKPPKLQEFTKQELISWIASQYRDLPPALTQGIDEIVDQILAESDQGVPELVLQEICKQCDCNWFEELDQWLKY